MGGHDISTGGTRPFPSRGSHKPSSLLLQLRGRGWRVKEDKGNGVAFRRDRVTRIRYTFRTGMGDPPPPSLGTQVSKPPDHKETKKKKKKGNPRPRPSSYTPRAPTLLHQDLAVQGGPTPSLRSVTQELCPRPLPIAIQTLPPPTASPYGNPGPNL